MKLNDEAIEAAAKSLFGDYNDAEKKWVEEAFTAASAAQFRSAESKALKKAWICYRLCEGGGAYDGPFFVKYEPEEGDYDKIEPILYYDAAQFPPSEDYAGLVKELRDWDFCWPSYSIEYAVPKAADALETVLADRDALLARLQAAADRLEKLAGDMRPPNSVTPQLFMLANSMKQNAQQAYRNARLAPEDDEALVEIVAREIFIERRSLAAAIAAIRPHIEAAERERCAKIAETPELWVTDKPSRGCDDIAAAIRSGK